MTDLVARLRAVEEAAEKATPGPWEAYHDHDRESCVMSHADGFMWVTPRPDGVLDEGCTDEDAAFIVAARNLPFRAVREELEALYELRDAALALTMHYWPSRSGRHYSPSLERFVRATDAVRAVLCSDPAGGER